MESKKDRGTSPKAFSEGSGRKKRRGHDGPRGPHPHNSHPTPNTPGRSPNPQQGNRRPPPGTSAPSGGTSSVDGSQQTSQQPPPHARGRERGGPPPHRRDRGRSGPKDQNRNPGHRNTSGGKSQQLSKNPPRESQESEARQLASARLAAIEAEDRLFKHIPKRYGVVFFETLAHAYQDQDNIKEKAALVDQLNVVIRAEASMDDPVLGIIPNVKVFAGAAWALIHDRRIADGWYDAPR